MQQKLQHYNDHGAAVGAANANQYEAMADRFIGFNPLPRFHLQSKRPREEDLIRYNPMTNEFGIMDKNGYIRTYFKPNTSLHMLPRNLDYYFANAVMYT
jgi:pyocin large subunit-like protein